MALLALVPFASLSVAPPLRPAAQAVLLLGLVAAQVPWLTHREGRPSSWLVAGVLLWSAAMVWGTAVGALSGNSLRYLVGQALSMALLPMGALVFWRRRGFGAGPLVDGLALASLGALLLHLLLPLSGIGSTGSGPLAELRLRVAPGVSFVGTALLAGLLCLGTALRGRDATRRRLGLAAAGTVASAILIVGGLSRGQWLAGVVGLVALLVSSSRRRGLLLLAGLASVALVLGFAALSYIRIATDRVDDFADSDRWTLDSRDRNEELADLSWGSGDGLEVVVHARGPSGTRLLLWSEASSAKGVRQRTLTRVAGSGRSSMVRAVVSLPEETQRVRVGAWIDGGSWTVERARLRRIGNGVAVSLLDWMSRPTAVRGEGLGRRDVVKRRTQQLIWALREPETDATVDYRAREGEAVARSWKESGPLRRFFGSGLGSTVAHGIPSLDSEGNRVVLPRTNYLHNFYLFLGFKLGAASIFVLAALAAFMIHAWKLGRTNAFGRAVFASWVAYAVWSVSSPELLDFRRTVLWGLVLAACALADDARIDRSAPPPQPSTPPPEVGNSVSA